MGTETYRTIYTRVPFKKQLFSALRRFVRPPKTIYQHLHFEGIINVPLGNTAFHMWNYGFQIENDLFWAGYGNGWEGTSLRLWARLVGGCRTVVDVGANTGVYALAAKALNPTAAVFGFEPVTRIMRKFQRNIDLNGFDIKAIEAAVSAQTGCAVLYESDTEHDYSASLEPGLFPGCNGIVERTIATLRLDDFVQQQHLSCIDLIKVDVEKHEPDVLAGCGNIVEQYRPIFLIEILARDVGEQLDSYFKHLHYAYYDVWEGERVRCVRTLGESSGNHLICPGERIEEFGLVNELLHADI